MATQNTDICLACQNLEDYAYDFVTNGLDDDMKDSMKNDTGLIKENNHNDCQDLNDMNDCLVKGMIEKIPSYNACDLDKALQEMMENMYNLLGAIIAGDCGQWENIHELWAEIAKLWDEINKLKNRVSALEGSNGKLVDALTKILNNLKESGAWKQTGSTIFEGEFNHNRNIATGNINVFGGTVDGNYYIRTNSGKTENDLAGGV